MTPDPLGGDVTNPQSLNRYAYALNNPTTFVDPLGLYQNCPNGVVFNNECDETASPGLSTLGYDFICMFSISSCPYYSGMSLSMGGGGGSGGGGRGTSWLSDFSSAPANNAPTKTCTGTARGLQGNSSLYGRPGSFGVVLPNSAAIIPR